MFQLLYRLVLATGRSGYQALRGLDLTILGVLNIFVLFILPFLLPSSWRIVLMANSLSVTPEYASGATTSRPTAMFPSDSAIEGFRASGNPSGWGLEADPLDRICPAESLPLDVPQLPTRERNIQELELMLNDNGLEEAANKLWSAFYGGEAPRTEPSVEEWSVQFLEFLKDADAPPQEGVPPVTHKAQLFFLRHLLSNDLDKAAPGEGLQAALLDKLRDVAGVVLGGDTISAHVGQSRTSVRDVHHHSVQKEEGALEPPSSQLPRSIVPIVGARNPLMLGLLWNLLIAYTGFDFYFGGESRTLAFFSWPSLLASLSGQSSSHIDAMCSVKRRRSLTERFKEWRRSKGLRQTRRQRRVSSLRQSSHRTLCELLDRLMSSLGESVIGHVATLAEAGVPVELGISHVQNMRRLHTETCMPNEDGHIHIPCSFEESRLARDSHDITQLEDDVDQQIRHNAQAESLKQAHTTITGLGALECKISSRQETNLTGADWGLLPRSPNEQLEQGTERVLETLNLAVATLFTTTSLDAMSSYWLAFENRTLKQATQDFKKNVLQILRSVGMDAVARKLLRSSGRDITDDEVQAAVDRLKDLRAAPDGMRAALALYAIRYPQQKETAFQNPTWVKVLYSHGFIPGFVRNLFFKTTAGMLQRTREARIQKARKLLREKLPSDFFEKLLQPFTFTVHSVALMQIMNFHSLKHDKTVGGYKRLIGEEKPLFLQDEPISAKMDKQIRSWASHGLSPALLESHADFNAFKKAWSKIDLTGLPLPDLSEWWARLNSLVVQGLESYLALEKHLEPHEDTVFTLANDSLRKLKANVGQTFFFTRIAHPKRQGPLQRLWEGTKTSLMRFLYRSPSRQHGVWFGVMADFEQLHELLGQLKIVIEAEPRLGIKVNIQEALLREVETQIRVKAAEVSRVPPLVERNMGMIGVRRDYGSLSEGMREIEFQTSMCIDHCRGLWQMILSSMLPTMLRPDLMQKYEKTFGTSWALKHVSDPNLINSRRMILKSDAALNFFDHSTPKEVREELKGLENGQGTMFAYYILFCSRAHQRLGNHYLGLHLQQQAPFMGNMVLDWIATRRKHAVAAIVSSFVLTFMGIYAVMSFFDILQNFVVSGATPPIDCVWNPIFQEMACNPVPGGASLGTAWVTAIEQVFLIGLFSGTAGGFSLFLTINSAIAIVVNQSKTLMRLQMCLGSAISRLLRRGMNSFSRIREYFRKRRSVKRVMLQRAVAGMKAGSTAAAMSNSEALEAADSLLDSLVSTSRSSSLKSTGGKSLLK
ncbi:Rhoptry neck protein 2-like protein 2 (Precursor), related [Eimeria brunetti]|uniref:Rhoptry neck protein 2-like protein 2 (Precursor), related n=1 Tax=Eimeria brunetti TaxID=51314 RepID=U6LNU2_9EIME|nr:Rhoptry neck protein 2-like protein 2 (Precursor), related [Eimeria brunetti]